MILAALLLSTSMPALAADPVGAEWLLEPSGDSRLDIYNSNLHDIHDVTHRPGPVMQLDFGMSGFWDSGGNLGVVFSHPVLDAFGIEEDGHFMEHWFVEDAGWVEDNMSQFTLEYDEKVHLDEAWLPANYKTLPYLWMDVEYKPAPDDTSMLTAAASPTFEIATFRLSTNGLNTVGYLVRNAQHWSPTFTLHVDYWVYAEGLERLDTHGERLHVILTQTQYATAHDFFVAAKASLGETQPNSSRVIYIERPGSLYIWD